MDVAPVSAQQPEPQKKSKVKSFFVGVFVVIVVIVVLGSIGNDAIESTNDAVDAANNAAMEALESTDKLVNKAQEDSESITPTNPPIVVSAAVLSSDYSENEVAADVKYKDKLIEVSGKIDSVENGSFDNELIIKLSDGKQYSFSGPNCTMKPSEKEKVIALKKEQAITLIGVGNSATIGYPMLNDCIIK